MSKQAYILTSGAGSDFSLDGIFDIHDEAMAEQERFPSPYCYGNEVLTVSISHDEYELLRWLINPAGPRPVAALRLGDARAAGSANAAQWSAQWKQSER